MRMRGGEDWNKHLLEVSGVGGKSFEVRDSTITGKWYTVNAFWIGVSRTIPWLVT